MKDGNSPLTKEVCKIRPEKKHERKDIQFLYCVVAFQQYASGKLHQQETTDLGKISEDR